MTRKKLEGKRVLTANLSSGHYAALEHMATQDRRYLGEMVRIIIEEAAKARGIKVEQGAQS